MQPCEGLICCTGREKLRLFYIEEKEKQRGCSVAEGGSDRSCSEMEGGRDRLFCSRGRNREAVLYQWGGVEEGCSLDVGMAGLFSSRGR